MIFGLFKSKNNRAASAVSGRTRYGSDIEIVSENAVLKPAEKVFRWPVRKGEGFTLKFRSVYQIKPRNWNTGIQNCAYRVRDRAFTDLSFLEGDVIRELADDMDIRLHEDGTRFVFSYTDIPTFDSGDREWDSMAHIALYRDEKGVNLLHCRHGYRIPQIEVCLGLTNTVPEVTEWLELLNTVE